MSSVQGKSPPVQVKEPYSNLDMVTCRLMGRKATKTNKTKQTNVGFHSATQSVQSTPADNRRKRVWQHRERKKRSGKIQGVL